ncbi:CHAT domain-containing protein [Dactylosporangium sp. NPDC051541]|uniref:CHAT domain-containing protein n=1 Tax=Dactylosporangium sp. NPDC051541 TaxID=3363977 RepID=UPI00379B9D15
MSFDARIAEGLRLIRRFGTAADPDDLEAGAGALVGALAEIPTGAPMAAAIAVVERELAGTAEDGFGETVTLSMGLALAYQRQWSDSRVDDGLRERAIELWTAVLDRVPGHTLAHLGCGSLYLDRAERTHAAADVAEALRLARLAADGAGAGDPLAAECWNLLANVHFQRWYLLGEDGGVAEAVACFRTAGGYGPEPDLAARIARDNLRAVSELHGRGAASDAQLRTAVDEAAATLGSALGADLVNRARLAGTLALTEITVAGREHRPFDVERVLALITPYEHVAMPDPHWRAELDSARSFVGLQSGDGADRLRAMEVLGEVAASPRFAEHSRAVFAETMPGLRLNQSAQSGDLRAFDAARALVREHGAAGDGWLAAVGDAWRHLMRDDTAAARTALAEARRLAAEQPGDGDEGRLVAGSLEAMAALLDGAPVDLGPAPAAPTSMAGAAERVARLGVVVFTAAARDDLATLRGAAREATALLPWFPAEHRLLRTMACEVAGSAELELARRDRADRAAARRAADRLAEACALAGGPHHQRWAVLAKCHALSLRMLDRPDLAGSRRIGLSALLAANWQALLQSGDDQSLDAARSAAATVRLVAGWCVADAGDDPAALDDLVAALDAGRGLVLHAVSTSRVVPELLAGAGHPELAARWRGGADGPDDLRERALHALSADAAVFAPAGPARIRAALTATGSDALVYLVPADEWQGGLAVVVPVAGPVEILPLPGLRTVPAPAVTGAAPRDLRPADGPAGLGFDELGRWAWTAAVGALVRYTRQWHLRRPPRLVLVPAGGLGRVPWHAAFSGDGARRRYAVEELVLSYGVSARMFCVSARHSPRTPESALIVTDEQAGLQYAVLEARAIQNFYPRGTLLSRPAVADVLSWVSAPGRGPSLLHLACHGHIEPDRPVDAFLALAGERLPARRLLELSRSADLDLERVVLSACSTGATGSVHDEAISMATAFLAGGARTVFGSLWRVPDDDTALLMYALHHHLSAERRAPVDALRAAQLWMLDPGREPLPGMPPALAGRCDRTSLADPRSWAAFVHLGR